MRLKKNHYSSWLLHQNIYYGPWAKFANLKDKTTPERSKVCLGCFHEFGYEMIYFLNGKNELNDISNQNINFIAIVLFDRFPVIFII